MISYMKLSLPFSLGIYLFLISCFAIASLDHYVLYTGTANGNSIIQLNLMPNGQFVDSFIQYSMISGYDTRVKLAQDYQYLISANTKYTNSYKVQPDGTLFSLSSITVGLGELNVSPNGKLIVSSTKILGMTTSGIIYNTGNTFFGPSIQFHPFMNTAIHVTGPSSIGLSTVNYELNTISLVTGVASGNGIHGIRLTLQGSIAIVYGTDAEPGASMHDVSVYNVNSTSLSTTAQALMNGSDGLDMEVTPDSRFAYVAGNIAIYTLSINSSSTTVTNPGITYDPPNRDPYGIGVSPLAITPDGRLLLYQYWDSSDSKLWISSAFINEDGSLTWTGYKFPYGANYANHGFDDSLLSWAIYPVYATGIPKELWKESPADTKIHSSQKLLVDK